MGEAVPAAPWKPPTMTDVGSSPSPGGVPTPAVEEEGEDDDDEEQEGEEEEEEVCA